MIDINVSYGTWPFHSTGFQHLSELEDHLKTCGINTALVSHIGAVWNPDVDGYNQAVINACSDRPGLIPIPILNPAWPAPFNDYHKSEAFPGVRLYPSYHGYLLNDPVMDTLVEYVLERGLVLFIQMRLEDERMQHPLARVEAVDIEDILALHVRFPRLQIVCLNAYLPEVRRIAAQSNRIGFDTAFCEWFFTMECMLDVLPPENIYLGTHSPFLYTQAGILKVTQSRVADPIKAQITTGNAVRLLGPSGAHS
ncbi:MAG: amidohydrolase family protein [Rhodothermaceae bacterium]|nr:amidohydrolase family protein [Rhodothermaceae bacterium]